MEGTQELKLQMWMSGSESLYHHHHRMLVGGRREIYVGLGRISKVGNSTKPWKSQSPGPLPNKSPCPSSLSGREMGIQAALSADTKYLFDLWNFEGELPGLSLNTCSSWTLRDHPLSTLETGLWKRDGRFSSEGGAWCRPRGGWLV